MSDARAVLAEVWAMDPESIPDDAAINAFAPWDSLGHITLLLKLSERFGFALTPNNVQQLITLRAIEEFLSTIREGA